MLSDTGIQTGGKVGQAWEVLGWYCNYLGVYVATQVEQLTLQCFACRLGVDRRDEILFMRFKVE